MNQTMRQVRKEFATASVSGVSPLVLGNCSHLDDLSTGALVRLSKVAECRLVYSGETLFRQSEQADSVYLLLDGAIRLERSEAATGKRSSYAVIAPYASFGDVVLLGEQERRYTAEATLDSVIIEIPLRPLIDTLSRNAPQALAWRGAIMARLHRREPDQVASFGWRILGKLSEIFEAA